MKINYRLLSFFTGITLLLPSQGYSDSSEELLKRGRQLFYESVETHAKVDSALHVFHRLQDQSEQLNGRALTYIGAATALRGKHAFWPHLKMSWVNKGLEIMDRGIERSPNDIEALFVYASTNYFLPFFFERRNDARQAFLRIVELLPEHRHEYDDKVVLHVIEFIREHADLHAQSIAELQSVKKKITSS